MCVCVCMHTLTLNAGFHSVCLSLFLSLPNGCALRSMQYNVARTHTALVARGNGVLCGSHAREGRSLCIRSTASAAKASDAVGINGLTRDALLHKP